MKIAYLANMKQPDGSMSLEQVSREQWRQIVRENPALPKEKRRYFITDCFRDIGVLDCMVIETAWEEYVVLSYNDCPFTRKLYRDFYILAFKRSNSLAHKKGAKYGELIITNYDPRPYLHKQLGLFDSEPTQMGGLILINIPQKIRR